MSRCELDSSGDTRLSLERYSIARQKAGLYLEMVRNESERLFSHFIEYVKENYEETHGFSETVQAFYSDVLKMNCDVRDRAVRSSLTNRFRRLMKRCNKHNSIDQVKLDDFLL